jgi:hypothetical protein
MDIGLATVLSTMGTVWTGDPLSLSPGFSIDGYHPKVMNLLGNLLGLLGKPRGVSLLSSICPLFTHEVPGDPVRGFMKGLLTKRHRLHVPTGGLNPTHRSHVTTYTSRVTHPR